MSRPPKPKNFWDDGETTPGDIRQRTANLKKVLGTLIKHALSTGPLEASRVARWHKDLLSGLSYVTDPALLGAYRGSDHPDLKNMGVRVGTACGVSPYQVNEALVDFFGNLQQRMSTLEVTIKVDQDKSRAQLRQIAEVAGWAHGEWVRIHPFANGNGRAARLIANWIPMDRRVRHRCRATIASSPSSSWTSSKARRCGRSSTGNLAGSGFESR
jgi:hypothetical protein